MNAILRSIAVTGLSLAVVGPFSGCDSEPSIGMLMARGNAANYRGEPTEALANYRRVTERYPGHEEARYRQGLALLDLGRPAEAREALEIAHEIDPDNPAYFSALVDALVAAGETEDLFELLNRFAEQTEGVEGYLALGRAAQRVGFPEEAERAFKTAARLAEPDNPQPLRELADLYHAIGSLERELDVLRVLYRMLPENDAIEARIRNLGEIPGPTFGRPLSSVVGDGDPGA